VPPAAGSGNAYWVTNESGASRLFTQVILPKNATGKLPALVLVPGGVGDSSDFTARPIAQILADQGYAVVIFDPDGRGKSSGKENLNGHIHQDGLAAVIRFAATLPVVDAARIGLVTYSYGITMGSGALARHPDLPVRFLIDWEGPANRQYTTSRGRRAGYCRMPRMSSSRMMRYSSSPSLTSFPEYFPKRILSPTFTFIGWSLPSSVTLPGPTAITSPSWGFSLAVSGMMMPPFFTSFSSRRFTRIRSCRGLNFFIVCHSFLLG
jgi:pimeloyl-ACP methyl ester carboxylesterase